MNVRRAVPLGYTITEVLIFLAVSGALFTMAALMLSGQQARTEFAQATRDIESQIQDLINDVSTGYYASNENFTCTTTASGPPTITVSAAPRGTNKDCIFVGKILHFAVAGTNSEGFNIYMVVGRREVEAGTPGPIKEPTTFDQAKLWMVDNASVDKRNLTYGLKVKKMRYVKSGAETTVGAVGLFSSFGQSSGGGNLLSGAQTVNLVPIAGTAINADLTSIKMHVDSPGGINNTSDINPNDGVQICFAGASSSQLGIVTIGSNNRQLSTKLDIVDSPPTSGSLSGACS